MARLRSVYRCQECGYSAPRGLGQCPDCSAWNTMVEEVVEKAPAPLVGAPEGAGLFGALSSAIATVETVRAEAEERHPTGLSEFDRLLGGGVIPGQVSLLAGPPGIGKSTLMLQAAARLSRRGKVLYVSGEESLRQISARARRLGVGGESLCLLSETSLAKVVAAVEQVKPWLVVLDSVQTVSHPALDSSPGSVAQVRECAAELVRLAKGTDTVVFLLGHVTKDGALAGPKVLEHIVDTVLYFDAERHDLLRVLRAHKNRFGPTDEIGLFEMGEGGLKEVADASAFFLDGREPVSQAGRAVSVTVEGSRPVLVEVQALVVPTKYPLPRRMATGLDLNRVLVLLAAMEKHLRLRLEDRDVFVSLTGGLRLKDPALDLAVCLAVASSAQDAPLPPEWVMLGEVGLLGQVGRVPSLERRLREAAKAGFRKALVPARALKEAFPKGREPLELNAVESLSRAAEVFMRDPLPRPRAQK